MAHVYHLSIENFRGIQKLEQTFLSNFVCLIGRGDSGKSSILEALTLVFSSSWNYTIFDNDFYNCLTENPIIIEATVKDLPDELIREDKFGLYLRGIANDGVVTDEIDEAVEIVLTIRVEVTKELEPKWSVVTGREVGSKPISATDRAKLNSFLVADYVDRHFTWSKGSPLYALLAKEQAVEDENIMIDALREAKTKIDDIPFAKFDRVIDKVKRSASLFGIDISHTTTTIDFKDIVIKDGKVCLHDETIPFRLKGKGSKRLISMAIQASIAEMGGIVMIDEIEQGLEPDRVQSLVSTLKKNNKGQVFITTHSTDVLVELETKDLLMVRKDSDKLISFDNDMQALLRKNPACFFAKKVIVAEGSTEIGICRALNKYRIANNANNMSFLGVKIADGGGSTMVGYSKGLKKSGFETLLFCDSDEPVINAEKALLIALGVEIVDWDGDHSIERAIIGSVPFPMIKDIFHLAAEIKFMENPSQTIEQHKTAMWDAVKSRFGAGCPVELNAAADSAAIREAIGRSAGEKSWFKRQDKAEKLGDLLFKSYPAIVAGSPIKTKFDALSKWIDQ